MKLNNSGFSEWIQGHQPFTHKASSSSQTNYCVLSSPLRPLRCNRQHHRIVKPVSSSLLALCKVCSLSNQFPFPTNIHDVVVHANGGVSDWASLYCFEQPIFVHGITLIELVYCFESSKTMHKEINNRHNFKMHFELLNFRITVNPLVLLLD